MRILNAVFLTWLQGWVTQARFQVRSSCLLCGTFFSDDSLVHYAVCPIQRMLSDTYLGLFRLGRSTRHFLCLADESPLILQSRALHLYIFKKTYDYCRVNNCLSSPQSISNVYRNFLVETCGLFPRLRLPSFKFSVTDVSEYFLFSDLISDESYNRLFP